jgi:hypothetical protein
VSRRLLELVAPDSLTAAELLGIAPESADDPAAPYAGLPMLDEPCDPGPLSEAERTRLLEQVHGAMAGPAGRCKPPRDVALAIRLPGNEQAELVTQLVTFTIRAARPPRHSAMGQCRDGRVG